MNSLLIISTHNEMLTIFSIIRPKSGVLITELEYLGSLVVTGHQMQNQIWKEQICKYNSYSSNLDSPTFISGGNSI
jgi:hypothetical protein